MRKHKGFTLVELVVVVMILGILAAVAVPKLLNTSAAATNNGLRQTLATVRDAVERYAAEHGGELPGENIKTELTDYLRGAFPVCPVGTKNADVAVVDAATLTVGGDESWMYSSQTGEFIVNSGEAVTGESGINYNQL